MQDLFSLGELYVSDYVKSGQENRAGKHDLQLVLTDDGIVRLKTTVPPEKMFGKYYYRSGLNNTMRAELKDVVDSVLKVHKNKESDWDVPEIWLDLAANDGTLLSNVPKNFIRIGIDPCEDSYKIEAEKHANVIVQDYFSAEAYKKSGYAGKANVITCCAMLYNVPNTNSFLQDVQKVLDSTGLFVVQLSYTPTMLSGLQFDQILSEHIYYFSLFNLKSLFEKNGFKLLDCTTNSCNGGSFRVFAMKDSGNEKLFGTQADRDMGQVRINSLLEYEKTLKLDQPETWWKFKEDVDALKEKTVSFIKQAKADGKRVGALGGSTKGNTLLQYFGLDNTLIESIVERNPDKVGLYTVGTNIPIISEAQFRSDPPDFILLLIWPFVSEIINREKEFLKKGRLIVPCPKFEII